MTKSILYASQNNIRKGAELFIKSGNIIDLTKAITNDTIIVAENPDDKFLTSLHESYGVSIVPMNSVKDGLSHIDELNVEYHLGNGSSVEKVAAITGIPEKDIAFSKAFFGKSRIEKATRA